MKYLYLACCMLLSLTNYAQKAKLQISDELEIANKKFPIDDILGSDGQFIYLRSKKGDKLKIAKMDSKFKIVKYVEIDVDDVMKGMEVIDSRMVNNNVVLITELAQKKEGKIVNYVWTLNTKTMEFDKPKAILDVSQKIIKDAKFHFMGISLTNRSFSDDRAVYYSDDTTKFAILASIPPVDKEDGKYNKELLTVYDMSHNKIWSSELEVPKNYDFFVTKKTTLGNDGSFYSFGIVYENEKDMKKNNNGTYMILSYDNKGKSSETTFNFGDKIIIDPKFDWSKNHLICAGFYSIKGSKKNITEGIAYIQMDKSGKIIKESYKEFPDEFIQSMRETKKASTEKNRDGDLGIAGSFSVRQVQARADGGAFLLAEEYYSYTVTSYTSNGNGRGTTTTTTYYVYGDKFVCGIDSNGQFEWLTDIPTNMTYTASNIGTFATYTNKDNLYLLYTDNEENIKKKLNQRPTFKAKYKNASTAIVSVDVKTGKAERRELIDAKDAEFMLLPLVYANIGTEMFILGGKFGTWGIKEYKIAKVSF